MGRCYVWVGSGNVEGFGISVGGLLEGVNS